MARSCCVFTLAQARMPVLLKTARYSTSRVTVIPRGADCAVACTVILYMPEGVPVTPPPDPLPLWQPSRIAATPSASAIAHAIGTRRFGRAKQHRAIAAISTNAPIAPSAMNFPPLPPRIGAAPVFGGGCGTRDVVLNITLNGTAVPGVVTGTLAGENMHVVSNGKLPGQIGVTVPVKILSGTTCSMKVPVEPAVTEICVSWPLARVI